MTMIEKVARALQAHDPANIGHKTGYALARIAIKAMRELTPEMLAASWDATTKRPPEEYMAMALLSPKEQHPVKMRNRYRAMIDAALSEGPTP